MSWAGQSPIKEVVGVWALGQFVCMGKAWWLASSRNLLTLEGTVPPESARPQMSKHEKKGHAPCSNLRQILLPP